MRVIRVESSVLRIPLGRPASVSGVTFTEREYNLVTVFSEDGSQGTGYARGGDLVHDAVARIAPIVLNSDLWATEALWQKMFDATLLVGRRGAVLRAMSAVDIALWDLKAKMLGLPLWRLLGAESAKVPAYVSAAYYRDGQSPDDVARELADCVGRGFKAVKMRVGGRSLKDDAARVSAAKKAIGGDIDLMVDANFAYDDARIGVAAGRVFQDLGVSWLEEPTSPDNLKGSARLAAALDMPISAGESESTRWGFRDLIAQEAADILQPDVTVVGGITEWLKVAALASAHHLPIAPHYFWEVHAHLVAATPCAFTVEYFERESDLVNFDDVLAEPMKPADGVITLSDRPGIGWVFKTESLDRYRSASSSAGVE